MDPITIIVTALALGAAAGLKPTAEKAVTEAYEGLKGLIIAKFGHASASVSSLEANPASKNRQGTLQEELQNTTAYQDQEVLDRAKELLKIARTHAPESAAAIGIDWEDVEGASLEVDQITSSSTGFRMRKGKFTGDIKLGKIRAGVESKGEESPNP